MVSQKDIAEHLNLSRSLVSKALSGNFSTSKINPETQKLIIDTARQMGYKPNTAAVSLATGKKGSIGVVIRSFGSRCSHLPALLTHGITEETRYGNHNLIITYFDERSESRCLKFLEADMQIDGVIFAGSVPQNITEKLNSFNAFPIITVCSEFESEGVSRVWTDNQRIGYIATQHLIERGCKNIANINTWPKRTLGYRQAMQEASLPVNEQLIFDSDSFMHTSGRQAVSHFINSGVAFDGIVTQCDDQAAGAINELLQRGIKVPEQVKVIGVDDAPHCKLAFCPITSVNPNVVRAGRIAFQMLLKQIEKPQQPPQSYAIEPSLYARQSTQ